MREWKKYVALVVLTTFLSAYGAANASAAAEFTASAIGKIDGFALNTQTFGSNAGVVKCNSALTTGPISKTASTEQHVTVEYFACTAFGFAKVEINPATFLLTTHTVGGTLVNDVHILNTITINVPAAFCSQRIKPQTVGSAAYENIGSFNVRETKNYLNIVYTSTGGFCGTSGTNGSLKGENELSRAGGGWLGFDA